MVLLRDLIQSTTKSTYYFDRQALGWWYSKGGDKADYRSVCDHVAKMFYKLTDRSVLLTWITEVWSLIHCDS